MKAREEASALPLPAKLRVIRSRAVNTLKVLRFIQTREYDWVRRLNLKPELRAEVERLLYRYIVYVLERNLRSVDFLWKLRRQMEQAA